MAESIGKCCTKAKANYKDLHIIIGDDHLKQGKSQLISLFKQQLMKNGLLESKINDMINIVRREDHCGFNKEKKTKQWHAYL